MPNTDLPTLIITGASACVGLYTAKSLGDRDFVVMACRELDKAARSAQQIAIPAERHAILELDLGSSAPCTPGCVAERALLRDTPMAKASDAVQSSRLWSLSQKQVGLA